MRFQRNMVMVFALLIPLAIGCGGGSSKKDSAPLPAISNFVATDPLVTVGDSTTLTATFTNGNGVVSGLGAIQSAVALSTGAVTQKTTYTLTVTNTDGVAVTSTVTILTTPWKKLPNLLSGYRDRSCGVMLSDGRVLIFGGGNSAGSAFIGTLEIYDPASKTFNSAGNLPISGMYYPYGVLLASGKVALMGGGSTLSSSSTPMNIILIFDPATNTTAISPNTLKTPRIYSTMTKLNDGRYLICGGWGPISSCEIFDPVTATSTNVSNMAMARYNHSAVLLPNGNVLIAGGWNGSNATSSCEIYNPTLNTWTTAASMPSPNLRIALSLLSNGKVLFAGGNYNGNDQSIASLYDPVMNSFTALPNMATPRNAGLGAMAIPVLNDGSPLLAENPPGRDAEYFNVSTNVFTAISGQMWYQNQGAILIKLNDGNVLKAGGSTAGSGGAELLLSQYK